MKELPLEKWYPLETVSYWTTSRNKRIIHWPHRLGTVSTYIARPKGDGKPQKAVLILSDVFGIFTNSQLVTDDFAANGYLAVLPDLFAGDKMDIGDFEAGRINIPEWLSRNGTDAIDPRVESVLRHLRESLGVKKIACAGYCFGGKVCTLHTKTRIRNE